MQPFSMLSMAVCAAKGVDWLGFKVHHPKNVLIVDEESGENRLMRRLSDAIKGEWGDKDLPIKSISLAGFMLDDPKEVELLQEKIEETEASLLIIDALTDVMCGDENSKKDTQPLFTNLRKVAESNNCAIVIIHHANKQGKLRGSTAITGAVDLMIKVESRNGSDIINFISEKTRDVEALRWSARAIWKENSFSLQKCSFKEKPQTLNE